MKNGDITCVGWHCELCSCRISATANELLLWPAVSVVTRTNKSDAAPSQPYRLYFGQANEDFETAIFRNGQRADRRGHGCCAGPAKFRRETAGRSPGGGTIRDHVDRWQTTSSSRSKVRRRDQERRPSIETLVGTADRPSPGRAQCAAHHHRRLRIWCAEHFWRSDPHARHGSGREERPAIQQHSLHGALFANQSGAPHRSQPSFRGIRRDL